MSRRPFDGIRPFGPFIDLQDKDISQPLNSKQKERTDSIPTFESVDDLPDSPMLRQYVQTIKKKTGNTEKEVINSKPVREYMKRLGVWSQVENGDK